MSQKFVRFLTFMMLLSLILVPQTFAAPNQPITMDHQDEASAPTAIIYVKHDASGSGDGTSWANAYTTLQDALAAASNGDQIWVAAGVYYPDEGGTASNDDQASTFQLESGVAIYGGFAGTETLLDERDWNANLTVLSGDIDGDDTNKTNGVISSVGDIVGSNAYHVVTGSGTDNTAILDGVTINAGQANGTFVSPCGPACGAGIYNDAGSPTLTNLTITANSANDQGGGMYNISSSNPTLTNVTITANSAQYGGGMYNDSSNPTLTNVTITANSAGFNGGGMSNNFSSKPTLTNVTITANSANDQGGGIDNFFSSHTALNNVIIWNNRASSSTTSASASIYNHSSSSTPTISHSLIANSGGSAAWESDLGMDDGDNIDGDPKFVQDGDPSTTPPTDGDYQLQAGSPAIDAGDNDANNESTDLAGNTRTQGGTIDMGAYERVVAVITPPGSGGGGGMPPTNQPPMLSTPMPDITVMEGAAAQVFNPFDYFSDPENDALYFTVVSNSNREVAPNLLVGLEFEEAMAIIFGTPGETTITIRAAEDTYHRTYEGTFKITVLERPQPTLAMSKSVSTQMVEAGEQVTYTLTISNSGAGSATNAHISDTLPAGLTFVDGSLSVKGLGIGTAGSAPPMLAEGMTLAANQSINISFAATVNADVMANQMITNTAQITSSEMLTPMLASEWIMTQPPSVMISDTIVTEGQPASRAINISNNNATVAVNLSKASALPVTIDYTTVPGTATADDYMPISGTLTIEAGQTEGHINLTIMDDEQAEENETFTIQLSNPTHAVMNGTTAALITISGNDQPPTAVSLTQMDAQSVLRPFDKLRAAHAQYPLRYAGALAALLLIGGSVWAMRRKEE